MTTVSIGTAVLHGLPVDADDHVAPRMPACSPGEPGDRLNDRERALVHLDLDPNPAEFPVQVLLELLVVLGLEVLGMGVQPSTIPWIERRARAS